MIGEYLSIIWAAAPENQQSAKSAKPKAQISRAVTAQQISAFGFHFIDSMMHPKSEISSF